MLDNHTATATARALTEEVLSFRDQMVDWQLGQLRQAQGWTNDWLKAAQSGLEIQEKAVRAWNRTLLDAWMPTKDEA
ncbi:MAG: hypothetical protein H6739_41075 [Alphaproteobacteria bacterium]|nr:hypothetical protein [Alphaproteobacteria bacterium]